MDESRYAHEACYACNMCTYVYIPSENQGVEFKDLPEDWVCPVCDAPKEDFELVTE